MARHADCQCAERYRIQMLMAFADPSTDFSSPDGRAFLNPATRCSQSPGSPCFPAYLVRITDSAQLASMKQLRPFLPSLYSEYLLTSPASSTAPGGQADHLLLGTELGEKSTGNEGEGDLRGPGGDGRGTYERGLGETYGFPGDARKMRERSKMKLWREYFLGELGAD